MAISLPTLSEKVEIVLERDSALDMTAEEYKQYIESKCNKELLKMKPGQVPTIFVMRKVLPFTLARKVQNEQVKVGQKGDMNFQMSFTLEEVRASLIDIINPPDVPADQLITFTKSDDGGASEDLIAVLHAAGIVQELYSARQVVVQGFNGDDLKKK